MVRLVERKPEDQPREVENAFEGIEEISLWRRVIEIAIQVAALITIYEFLVRLFAG